MKEEKILQIGDNLYTLEDLFNISPDAVINSNDEGVHRALMGKATLRLGFVKRGVYFYLIDGKFIQVNDVSKK